MSEAGRTEAGEHAITVTVDGPGRYLVTCSCERLSRHVTDFDLGLTIMVHLSNAPTSTPTANASSQTTP